MNTRGYTLVELLLSMVIIGVLATAIAPEIIMPVEGMTLVSGRRNVLAEAQAALEHMVREIRLIPGSSQITSVGSSSFTFQYPAGTSITYSLSGTNLFRNSDLLLSNITSLAFTYYTDTGSTTSSTSNVRSVGIQLTAQSVSLSALTLRTRVFIRNTGNDYANFTSP